MFGNDGSRLARREAGVLNQISGDRQLFWTRERTPSALTIVFCLRCRAYRRCDVYAASTHFCCLYYPVGVFLLFLYSCFFFFFRVCVCLSFKVYRRCSVYAGSQQTHTCLLYFLDESFLCASCFFSFLSDVPPPPFYSYSLPFLLFPSFFLSTPAHPARECISPREKAATTPCFWCTSLWSNSDDTAGWLHRSQEGSQTRPRPNLPCSLL